MADLFEVITSDARLSEQPILSGREVWLVFGLIIEITEGEVLGMSPILTDEERTEAEEIGSETIDPLPLLRLL